MAALHEDARILSAFMALPFDAPTSELTDFIATALSFNASEKASISPDSDAPVDDTKRVALGRVAAALDAYRLKALTDEAKISSAVLMAKKTLSGSTHDYFVTGLVTFLKANKETTTFTDRIQFADSIRNYLTGIGDGHKLEGLAAALLEQIYQSTSPTRRSADQGVDCLARQPILEVHSWCSLPDMSSVIQMTGEQLHIIASCKANEGNISGGTPKTISPAHIRELIGAWLIQRSSIGLWQKVAGIKLLSPMQLLLVTTYRLSDDSMQLCRELGVAVWGVTELIYLICMRAPDVVFSATGGAFDSAGIDAWIATAGAKRI